MPKLFFQFSKFSENKQARVYFGSVKRYKCTKWKVVFPDNFPTDENLELGLRGPDRIFR